MQSKVLIQVLYITCTFDVANNAYEGFAVWIF
jgi:hypothetical protein